MLIPRRLLKAVAIKEFDSVTKKNRCTRKETTGDIERTNSWIL
jgi:hypothetical protein